MKPIALIGPAGTGKSTVGEILAGLLDRDFVDIDAIGHRYYDTVGQPVSDLVERIEVDTFRRAHRWWQPARLAALAALADFPTAVIALGAGHSHFEDAERFEEAARVLGAAFVVLLLPSPDPAESLRVLRERCDRDKGTDWTRDGHDHLEEWIGSPQNLSLADVVIFWGRAICERHRTPDRLGRDRRSRLTERLMDCRYGTRRNVHRHGDLLCMEHTLEQGT